jgi:hypothetical protein
LAEATRAAIGGKVFPDVPLQFALCHERHSEMSLPEDLQTYQ